MTVSNCPRCNEPFRLPVDPDDANELPDGAYGQCPWCRETFPMSELLRGLPPMLAVMSADGHPIQTASRVMAAASTTGAATDNFIDDDPNATVAEETIGNETVDNQLLDDSDTANENSHSDDLRLSEPNDDEFSNDEFLVEEEDSLDEGPVGIEFGNISDDWGSVGSVDNTVAPMRVANRARVSRKKKSSPWKTAVGVLIGGAAALPIADGILTVAGRESILKIWPASWSSSSDSGSSGRLAAPPMTMSDNRGEQAASAGRVLSMPSIPDGSVSVDQSASEVLEQIKSASDDAAKIDDPIVARPAVADYSAVNESTADEPTADEPTADESTAQPTVDPFAMPTAEPADAAVPEPEANTTEPEMSGIELPTDAVAEIESADPAPLDPAPTDTATADTVNAEPDAAQASSTADKSPFGEAVSEANEMLDAVLQMSDDDPLRRKALAMAYREIAEVASLADADNEAARELLVRVKKSPLLKKYENASTNWFTYSGRETDGILIVGEAGANSSGPTIKVGADKIISVKSGPKLPPADRVIALGRIVGDGSEAVVEVSVAEPL